MVFAQYQRVPDEDYWLEKFTATPYASLLEEARRSPFVDVICSSLGRSSSILDAGAGIGRYVQVYKERGFKKVVGIDINAELVSRGRKKKLDLRHGSVLQLPFKDAMFDAYIDFGVMEHFDMKKQETFLREAHRVLRAKGRLYSNVTYMTPIRRLSFPLMWLRNEFRRRVEKLPFYQYIYKESEITGMLKENGFSVLSTHHDGVRLLVMAEKD